VLDSRLGEGVVEEVGSARFEVPAAHKFAA
jgi:hypothetical protein